MDTKAFWKRIKLLAREKNVTQVVLAKAIGMPLDTLKHWISRDFIPPLDYTVALSEYFGVSIHYLVYGKEANFSAKIKEAQKSLKVTGKKIKALRRSIQPEIKS